MCLQLRRVVIFPVARPAAAASPKLVGVLLCHNAPFMRVILVCLLVGTWHLQPAVAQTSNCFALTATILRPQTTNTVWRLAIDLSNTCNITQRVVILTNVFEGRVSLRNAGKETREFWHTNYWNMVMTTYWIPPTLILRPGTYFRFEATLDKFIDPKRPGPFVPRRMPASLADKYPTLASELAAGSDLVCTLDIYQETPFANGNVTFKKTSSLASPPIRYSK
jgi:hypothetical protein